MHEPVAEIVPNTQNGKVKLLDFGLAKALDPSATANGGSGVDPTQSPTLAAMATEAGIILGQG